MNNQVSDTGLGEPLA